MKEYVITKKDEGRRLDKYVMHILADAPASFTYKMLRKKNIVLNDKKASGNELICDGDVVKFYLSDATFDRFSSKPKDDTYCGADIPPVVYEDDDIMIINKPKGMLSQRSSAGSVSLNEIMLAYLVREGITGEEDLMTFTPSVCNRLDRNTSGLITYAKTYRGSKCLSEAFASHTISKYYRCIVKGRVDDKLDLTGSIVKDAATNTVRVFDDKEYGSFINTVVAPVISCDDVSLLDILLVTGKTHQIRAHLASIGHPIIGDSKYGDAAINRKYRSCGIDSQMLVCYKMIFPDDIGLADAAGRTFTIDMPDEFKQVI